MSILSCGRNAKEACRRETGRFLDDEGIVALLSLGGISNIMLVFL